MKLAIFLAILLILIAGFLILQNSKSTLIQSVSGTQNLLLSEQDLQQLGMISDGNDCITEEYSTYSGSQSQHSACNYIINGFNDTKVFLELQKFTNSEDLDGTYQYESQHLFSVEGLISENTYGDKSRFRINNVNDYGGQFNDPNVYYYHLWITKKEYLIHITSGGSKEAGEYVKKIGLQILSKFG